MVYEGWPDKRIAEPGNTLALKHGADSERFIAERAEQVHAAILEVAPWINEPHFLPEVARYLRACAREELLHSAIEQVAAAKGADKVPSRQWEQATAAARLASQLAAGLGLSPLGHAKLRAITAGAEVAQVGLADLMAQGRESRLRAEARFAAEAAQSPQEPLNALEAPDPADATEEGL